MIPWRVGRGATLPFFSPASPTRGHCTVETSKQKETHKKLGRRGSHIPRRRVCGLRCSGSRSLRSGTMPGRFEPWWAGGAGCQSKLFQKGVGTADQEPIESAPAPSTRALDRCTAQADGSWLRFSLRWTTRRAAGWHEPSNRRSVSCRSAWHTGHPAPSGRPGRRELTQSRIAKRTPEHARRGSRPGPPAIRMADRHRSRSRRREKFWQARLPQRAHCRSRAGAMHARCERPVQRREALTKAWSASHHAHPLCGYAVDGRPASIHDDPACKLLGPCADWSQVGAERSAVWRTMRGEWNPPRMRPSTKVYFASADTSLHPHRRPHRIQHPPFIAFRGGP